MRTTPDARTLGAAAQQLLRRQVVRAVRRGMTQTAAARTYGASLRAPGRDHHTLAEAGVSGTRSTGKTRTGCPVLGRRDGAPQRSCDRPQLCARGETPITRTTGQRFERNMISAITNKGALAFMVFQGRFRAPVFVQFLTRLLKSVHRRIYLIVDGHPVHRTAVVTRFVARHTTRLRLIRLPGYCPELNPDELLNHDVKTNGLGRSRPANRTELLKTVRGHLHRRQKQPQVIKKFFQEQHVRYAA